MGKWEFVLIFVLVLIGAGITNILHGVGLLMRDRLRVRTYWVHTVWLIVTAFSFLSVWFSLYTDQGHEYGFWEFASFFLSFGLLYLLTVLSFPDHGTPGPLDLRTHFLQTHRAYFGVWALVWSFPFVQALLDPAGMFSDPDGWWFLFYFALSVLGAIAGGARAHACFAIAILVAIPLRIL